MIPNPFALLGLPERPDLDDETVRTAWRAIAAATHPDRADGGDLARYTQASAAYAELRTPWSRSEAYADIVEQAIPLPHRAVSPLGLLLAVAWIPDRIRRGRPLRLLVRAALAAGLSLAVLALIPGQPATPADVGLLITWFVLTVRRDLAPPPERLRRLGGTERADHDGGVQFIGGRDPRGQAAGREGRRGRRNLALAGLDQQVAAGHQPLGCPHRHAPQYVQAVRPAIQCDQRLVRAGLWREEADLPGGDVRYVGGQDPDPASQQGGQRLVQVALVDAAGDVAPGAADGGRIEVDGVHLCVRHGRGQRGGDGARAAAQVDDNGPPARDLGGDGLPPEWTRGVQRDGVPPEQQNSLLDKELGTASWHEDPGLHGDPQPAELGPAEDLLQR